MPNWLSFICVFILLSIVFVSAQSTTKTDAELYNNDILEMEAHNEKRIIGGSTISSAEWRLTRPWLVQNVCDYGNGAGWIPCGCSSTIVNEHYLVTAGHCLNCPYSYKVGLRFADGSIETQTYQEIHTPKWQYGSVESKEYCGIRNITNQDIGLQYFEKPIKFRYGVRPFPGLLSEREADCKQKSAYVSGWGASAEDDANYVNPVYSNKLNKLRETVQDSVQCQAVVNGWFQILESVSPIPLSCSFNFHDGLICASAKELKDLAFSFAPDTFGVPVNPLGVCLGDSGSPLYDPIRRRILGFVSDNLATSIVSPCGYGIDVFTRWSNELIDWVKSEIHVTRPKRWTCPAKSTK